MKATITRASLALLLSGVATAQRPVGICEAWAYADRGLYCRMTEQGSCGTDLGDFPVENTWPLQLYIEDGEPTHGMFPLMQKTGQGEYIRYKDMLYLDASPDAYAPMGFKINEEFYGGEVSGWWITPYGILQWGPSVNYWDDGSSGSGFQRHEVEDYPGLFQLYWNQTLFDATAAGTETPTGDGIFCYGGTGNIVDGDRPF